MWKTWFDATFAQLIVFHHSLFYGHSNVPMGVGFRASSSISTLQRELATTHGRIQELVSNFLLGSFIYCSFTYTFFLVAQMATSEGMTEAVRTQQRQSSLRIEELVQEGDELLSRLARVSLAPFFYLFAPTLAIN